MGANEIDGGLSQLGDAAGDIVGQYWLLDIAKQNLCKPSVYIFLVPNSTGWILFRDPVYGSSIGDSQLSYPQYLARKRLRSCCVRTRDSAFRLNYVCDHSTLFAKSNTLLLVHCSIGYSISLSNIQLQLRISESLGFP